MKEILLRNLEDTLKEYGQKMLYKIEVNGDNYWLSFDEFEGLKISYGKPAPPIRKVGQKPPTRKMKKFPSSFDEILIIYKQLKSRLERAGGDRAKKLLNILSREIPNNEEKNYIDIELEGSKVTLSLNSDNDLKKLKEFLDEINLRIESNSAISKAQYFDIRKEIELLKSQLAEKNAEGVQKTWKKLWATISNVGTIIGYVQLFLGMM